MPGEVSLSRAWDRELQIPYQADLPLKGRKEARKGWPGCGSRMRSEMAQETFLVCLIRFHPYGMHLGLAHRLDQVLAHALAECLPLDLVKGPGSEQGLVEEIFIVADRAQQGFLRALEILVDAAPFRHLRLPFLRQLGKHVDAGAQSSPRLVSWVAVAFMVCGQADRRCG